MAYTRKNYPTKTALIKDVKELRRLKEIVNPTALDRQRIQALEYALSTYNPSGLFPTVQNGMDTIEGPHYPRPHKWYATVTVKEGVVCGAR